MRSLPRLLLAAAAAAALAPGLAGAGVLQSGHLVRGAIEFARIAIRDEESDLMLSRMAAAKAASPQVRAFAASMVRALSAEKAALLRAARADAIEPPDSLTDAAQAESVKLASLSGPAFDHSFLAYEIADHRRQLAFYRAESGLRFADLSGVALRVERRVAQELTEASALVARLPAKE